MQAASHPSPTLKCLIVDDEALARRELRVLLSVYSHVEVCGEASDVATALELTIAERPDVVFLDIKMHGESGFDYVAQVSTTLPRIVFVTAYDQYALRGFECNAMDYLLKPVQPQRLAESLRRVREALPTHPLPKGLDDVIFIRGTTSGRFATWEEISHIRAEGNYSRVSFADGASLSVLRPLKEWLEVAPEGLLLQIHRTAIVRRRAIREIIAAATPSRKEVVMITSETLPVGRAYLNDLREFFSELH